MTFAAVDASGGTEYFPQHPDVGEWETLKGRMLPPPELPVLESTAHGDSRHQAYAGPTDWVGDIIVNTGETRGGGAMAK